MFNYGCHLPPQQCNRVISKTTVRGLTINAASLKDDPVAVGGVFRLPQ
jgi:hypothetical protein